MADLRKAVDMVQLALQNSKAGYRQVIEDTILVVWDTVARSRKWPFLYAPTPIDIAVSANDRFVTASSQKAEAIAMALAIVNSSGLPQWTYETRPRFLELLQGLTTYPTGATATIFTDAGIEATSWRFELNPMPTEAGTYKLQWQEAGTLANFAKLPQMGLKVIVHGVKSMVAPPYELTNANKRLKWQAQTFKEEQLFQDALANMAFHYQAVDHITDGITVDGTTAGAMYDANDM